MTKTMIAEDRVEGLMAAYLAEQGKDAAQFSIELTRLGDRAWVIDCLEMMIPRMPSRFVMDENGRILPVSADSLQTIFRTTMPETADFTQRLNLVKGFVALHDDGKIIEAANDIPDVERNPLDPDLAQAICAPYAPKPDVLVMYGYVAAGGLVRRYRFEFDGDGRLKTAVCAELAYFVGGYVVWK